MNLRWGGERGESQVAFRNSAYDVTHPYHPLSSYALSFFVFSVVIRRFRVLPLASRILK